VPFVVLGAIMAATLKLAWGIVPSYLSERFPTKQRSVGAGFGYSSGALAGGAGISLFVWWTRQIPIINPFEGDDFWLSPAVVLTAGAAMTFLSLLCGPETKDLELSRVEVLNRRRQIVARLRGDWTVTPDGNEEQL
jgi:MFS transporter, MHS family, proline/betaine transporter